MKARLSNQALAAIALVGIGSFAGVAIGLFPRAVSPLHPQVKPVPTPMPGVAERRKENESVIARLKSDPKPEAQDKVGEAEMRLAYLDAEKKDFAKSRERFLAAEKIKGTGSIGADYGGINDQAAYQAAVCLVAEHKDEEARAAFKKFMVDYKLSPLVFAAEKRLVRMNHGKADAEGEALLQSAIKVQEARGRFETAVCGPKTVEYLLQKFPKKFGLPPKDYKELASLFGTTNSGTSMEGLHKGLRKLGIQSYALELNRKDFQNLMLPAILLDGDHYFAVIGRDGSKLTLFDTLLKAERQIELPPLEDADFRATVIAFSMNGIDQDSLTVGNHA